MSGFPREKSKNRYELTQEIKYLKHELELLRKSHFEQLVINKTYQNWTVELENKLKMLMEHMQIKFEEQPKFKIKNIVPERVDAIYDNVK